MNQLNYHSFSLVTLAALFCWSLLDLSLCEALTVPAAFTRILTAGLMLQTAASLPNRRNYVLNKIETYCNPHLDNIIFIFRQKHFKEVRWVLMQLPEP